MPQGCADVEVLGLRGPEQLGRGEHRRAAQSDELDVVLALLADHEHCVVSCEGVTVSLQGCQVGWRLGERA